VVIELIKGLLIVAVGFIVYACGEEDNDSRNEFDVAEEGGLDAIDGGGDDDSRNEFDVAEEGGFDAIDGGGDDGSDISVSTFQFSACKSEYTSSFLPPGLLSGRSSENYNRLQCIAWRITESGHSAIDLVNFVENCGFPVGNGGLWRGKTIQDEDGTLDLIVEWDLANGENACGSCMQDFSFEIIGLKDIGEILKLKISTRSCTGECEWIRYDAILPVGDNSNGIVCRYPESVDWEFENVEPGSLYTPSDRGQCQNDLIQIQTQNGGEICALKCTKNADYPLSDILSCSDGACRLSKKW